MTRLLLSDEATAEAQRHPHWPLVKRVAASQCFHSSARMRELLFYVADCALRNCPEDATEQQIGIHVFGRSPGFNSGEDSIVRTQARALRQRLAEYFNHEGLDEPTVLEVPKGHYLPVFRARVPSGDSTSAVSAGNLLGPATHAPAEDLPSPGLAPIVLVPHAPAPKTRGSWRLLITALTLCAVLPVVAILFRQSRSPIQRFWGPFLSNNASLVIYSNAVFTGDSTNGLKYAGPQNNAVDADHLVASYTGIGELTGVYKLTRLFDAHHATFTLKRSLLVTWDQAQMSNLIFIGSVAENSSLRVLPPNPDFTMTAEDGFAGFVNHRPKPGEASFYGRPEHPFNQDYAMLALLPGLESGREVLIFSGLTTLGTQAAVEFALDPECLKQLLPRVLGPHGEVRPFEALIQTTIGGGVPLQSRLVAVHAH